MAFSSTLTTFTNPTTTDKLNSPSHASIETAQNDAIKQVETIIGTDASTLGTIIGDLRNANSAGGGHVQAANKGGTGQTSYNKGNLLVAQSSSVISKLAVGLDGQILKADSSVASGVKWAESASNKIATSNSSVIVGASTTAEQSILSLSIPGSTLGTTNAVRALFNLSFTGNVNASSVFLSANFGAATPIASVALLTDSAATYFGKLEILVRSEGATGAQAGGLIVSLQRRTRGISSIFGYYEYRKGTASADSNSSIILGLTSRFVDSDAGNNVTVDSYTVEKIT